MYQGFRRFLSKNGKSSRVKYIGVCTILVVSIVSFCGMIYYSMNHCFPMNNRTLETKVLASLHENELRTKSLIELPYAANFSILILYSYFEGISKLSNTPPDLAALNLKFFIQIGVLGPTAPDPHKAMFVFIINGGNVSVTFPKNANNVFLLRRANTGLEFCGVKEALEKYNAPSIKHFVILNSSVRGPFLPNYMQEKPWTDAFIHMITPSTKLVGTSVNCYCNPCVGQSKLNTIHLQSFFLVTDTVGLDIIAKKLICTNNKVKAILTTELGMSQAILAAGFNLGSNLHFWYGHDFRQLQPTLLKCAQVRKHNEFGGDVMHHNAYFGTTVHPFEVIFSKVNREGMDFLADKHSIWSLGI
mmetsp:Transcript_10288/g.14046  ORF Transcript_10288/g.14046 Transcript_10288/m.14046 type:complete len:359 (+) Transcript_10288:137-1213(+)